MSLAVVGLPGGAGAVARPLALAELGEPTFERAAQILQVSLS